MLQFGPRLLYAGPWEDFNLRKKVPGGDARPAGGEGRTDSGE
jgi:hypothetical protein